jgi:predicted RNase H-like HicB family nuclease
MVTKFPLTLVKSCDGDYTASSCEATGFFALGDSKEEVIQNAKEGLAIMLGLDEKEIRFDITEIDESGTKG